VEAWDIVADEGVLVPAHAVFHPLPRGCPPLFRTNTNGLASGNTLEEAVFHGLAEIVERDAWSLVEVTKRPGPRIMDAPPGLPAELLRKFAGAKVEVTVRDITSDLGIPTCAAVADDALLRDPRLLTIGMGTHTSARIAYLRALTEVAQSRLTQIHGAREDTTTADLRTRMGYERVRRMNRYWFDADAEEPFSALPSADHDDFLKDIGAVVSALGKAGMDRVLVADLTRPEIGVPVVRVIVPGLEVYAMDNERMGERCRDAERRRLSRPQP
jgi:ribosomal protein S12 methylthiotransferase accessory factor